MLAILQESSDEPQIRVDVRQYNSVVCVESNIATANGIMLF